MARAGPRSSPRFPVAHPGSSRTSGLDRPASNASFERIPADAGVDSEACDSQVSAARKHPASGSRVTVVFITTIAVALLRRPRTTDASGVAHTTLTTSQEAIVTANAGGQEATADSYARVTDRYQHHAADWAHRVRHADQLHCCRGRDRQYQRDVLFDFGDGTSQNLVGPSCRFHERPRTPTGTQGPSRSARQRLRRDGITGIGLDRDDCSAQRPLVGHYSLHRHDLRGAQHHVVVSANVTGGDIAVIRYIWDFGRLQPTRTLKRPESTDRPGHRRPRRRTVGRQGSGDSSIRCQRRLRSDDDHHRAMPDCS